MLSRPPDAFFFPQTIEGLYRTERAFRQCITAKNRKIISLLNIILNRFFKGRGPVCHTNRIVSVLFSFGLLGQYQQHHPDEVEFSGPVFPDLIPESACAESVDEDQARSGCQTPHGRIVLGIGMVQGQTRKEAVALFDINPARESLPAVCIGLVGYEHTLRGTGCSRGVHDCSDMIPRRFRTLIQLTRRLQQVFKWRPARHRFLVRTDKPLQLRRLGFDGLDNRGKRMRRDDRTRLGVPDNIFHLLLFEGGIDWDQDSPYLRKPHPRIQKFRAVSEHDADPIALTDTQIEEPVGHPVCALIKVCVGNLFIPVIEIGLVRIFLR